jgi:hypothetical protein
MIVDVEFSGFFLAKLFQWICPQDIAHEAVGWGFSESIDLYG